MPRVCVFCGSNRGGRAGYATATRELASALVGARLSLVYGGGRVGLMGEIANEVLRLGGQVTGVIPRSLVEREVGHTGLTDLRVVETMHERKALMNDLSFADCDRHIIERDRRAESPGDVREPKHVYSLGVRRHSRRSGSRAVALPPHS